MSESPTQPSRAQRALYFAAAFAVALAVFVPMGFVRLIVRDEGFYLLASEMVMANRLPYLDFFYTQTPAMPYLYGGWIEIFGHTWVAARMFSAVLASATGALLFVACTRREGLRFGAVGLSLYLLSDVVLCWYSVVKSYALVTFLLFAAFVAVQARSTLRPWAMPLAAGFCLGLAVNVRLIVVVAVPVLLLVLVARLREGERARPLIGAFALGFGLAFGPALVLLAAGGDAFWFDNLGYHLIRSDDSQAVLLGRKLDVLLALAGIGSGGKGYGFQLPLLLYANLAYLLVARLKRWKVDPALWLAALLLAAHFVPSPAYFQYFSILVPFLILPAVALARGTLAAGAGASRSLRTAAVGIAFLVVYAAYLPLTLQATTTLGASSGPNLRTRSHVIAVTEAIDRVAEAGEAIYTTWPGFAFGSHATLLSGTENQFGMDVAEKLPPDRRRRYKLMSREEAGEMIARGRVRVLALPERIAATNHPDLAGRYDLVEKVGATAIYVLRD